MLLKFEGKRQTVWHRLLEFGELLSVDCYRSLLIVVLFEPQPATQPQPT